MSASSTTEVSIFGQTYYIQAGGDEDQARQAANLVDKKMNLIASRSLPRGSPRGSALGG